MQFNRSSNHFVFVYYVFSSVMLYKYNIGILTEYSLGKQENRKYLGIDAEHTVCVYIPIGLYKCNISG